MTDEKDKKEIALKNPGSLSSIDFDKFYNKVIELVNDQAMLDVDVENISLSEIELRRAKFDNYLQALANILEVKHKFEILKGQAQQFKRTDELEMLNDLRETAMMASKISRRNMKQASLFQDHILNKQESGEESDADDRDILASVEEILDRSIERVSKLTNTSEKLIRLERESGGRSMGDDRQKPPGINYMMKLEDKVREDRQTKEYGDSGTQIGKARVLSQEEIQALAAPGRGSASSPSQDEKSGSGGEEKSTSGSEKKDENNLEKVLS